jgi:hypothetical protein
MKSVTCFLNKGSNFPLLLAHGKALTPSPSPIAMGEGSNFPPSPAAAGEGGQGDEGQPHNILHHTRLLRFQLPVLYSR